MCILKGSSEVFRYRRVPRINPADQMPCVIMQPVMHSDERKTTVPLICPEEAGHHHLHICEEAQDETSADICGKQVSSEET